MIRTETTVRVRYADTDKMGVVYYARYLEWFEVGRTEMLREIGLPYAEIEETGVGLPVIEAHCEYKNSAQYDDQILIVSMLHCLPKMKIHIDYEIYNAARQLLAQGYTVHIFWSLDGRPVRPPKFFLDALRPYFDHERKAYR